MKIRIVLADDHPVVRVGVRTLLEREPDMQVVGEAGTALQAVALAQELKPDVVVADISMPGNGLTATQQIRATCPNTQVLILTVHAEERYLLHVLKVGAAGYVHKSSVDEEIVSAIRIVAHGGVFLYPAAAKTVVEDYQARLRRGEEDDTFPTLSDREREVLKCTALGYSSSEIGHMLALSSKSVDTYRARIMDKLYLRNRASLVQYALFHGLLTEDVT